MGLLGGASMLMPLLDDGLRAAVHEGLEKVKSSPPDAAAKDQDAWKAIRKAFDYPEDYTNLENGYYSPTPKLVLESYLDDYRRINKGSTHYMRRQMEADFEGTRLKLAAFAGVEPTEIALTRNTTESLDLLISGLTLQRGDEVVISNYDYGSMVEAWEQQQERYGIVIRRVELPTRPTTDDELIEPFRAALTERTRAMLVTHMVNLNGMVLPARTLTALGRSLGIHVIVDAAHSFAHLNYVLPDLDSDYLGCSLHKWLCAPLGNGLLHVKRNRIAEVWPLFGDRGRARDDIRKFEHNGTKAPASWLGIRHAIDFHNRIGSAQKQARLQYLKQYWTERVQHMSHVELCSPTDPAFSCAIATVGVKGMAPTQLAEYLLKEHKVFTVGISTGKIQGVRVTPHLYNTTEELDLLVAGLEKARA